MKKFIWLLVLISFNCFSQINSKDLDIVKEKLRKEGFNPNSRVTIVPDVNLRIPKNLKASDKKSEILNKGYLKEHTPRALELIKMHEIISYLHPGKKIDVDVKSTTIKKTLSEIPLAYDFKEVPSSAISNLIGFAPSGAYDNGWSGIVEYFDTANVGSCAYTENNLQLSHGTEKIGSSSVRYDVNGKVTVIDIRGTKQSGYLYTVHWADDLFFRDLECASMNYTDNKIQEVIDLAIKIENSSQ